MLCPTYVTSEFASISHLFRQFKMLQTVFSKMFKNPTVIFASTLQGTIPLPMVIYDCLVDPDVKPCFLNDTVGV